MLLRTGSLSVTTATQESFHLPKRDMGEQAFKDT